MKSVARIFATSAMMMIAALSSGCIAEADEQADDAEVVDLPDAPALEAEAVTYQTIRINFIKIDVHDDADNWPNGEGEIFYEFKVDNEIVVARPWNNPAGADSGESVTLNVSDTITLPRTLGSSFTIYGSVSEDDDFFSGAVDNAGSFIHTYAYEEGWSPGDKNVRLTGDGLDVTVYYRVTLL